MTTVGLQGAYGMATLSPQDGYRWTTIIEFGLVIGMEGHGPKQSLNTECRRYLMKRKTGKDTDAPLRAFGGEDFCARHNL